MKIKNTILTTTLIAMGFVSIITSSCKKSSSTSSTPAVVPSGSISAKINNVAWSSSTNTGTLLRSTSFNSKRLDLTGTADSKRIILSLEDVFEGDNVTIGTYTFGGSNDNALFSYYTVLAGGGTLGEHFPLDGTIQLTKCDLSNKTVTGTFNFRSTKIGTEDTLVVTNGVFTDVPYKVFVE